MGNERRQVGIYVDVGASQQQMKIIADGMGNISTNTKKMADGMGYLTSSFNSLFAGYLGFNGIRQLVAMSDTMQGLTNRIAVFAGSHEAALKVMDRIGETANATRTSVADLGEVYARLGSSLQATNISSEVLLSLTKVLQNSFRVSGSTVSETTATIIQLSQAFSSGTLRGQELRSVMLQNAVLAKLLRERFGPNLAKDAEAGLISITEVMKVLFKHQKEINDAAAKMAPTFGQTLTTAFNNASIAINHLNENFGIASKFAQAVEWATSHIGQLLSVVTILAVSSLPLLVTKISALELSLTSLNPWVLTLLAGLVAVTAIVGEGWDMSTLVTQIKVGLARISASYDDAMAKVLEWRATLAFTSYESEQHFKAMAQNQRDSATASRAYADALWGVHNAEAGSKKNPLDATQKQIQDFINGIKNHSPDKLKKIKDVLAELNKEFLTGKINLEEYNKRILDFDLYKLHRQFQEGKFDVEKYSLELQKLHQRNLKIWLDDGSLSLEVFNHHIADSKIEELNIKIRAGTLALKDYSTELVKVSDEYSLSYAFGAGAQGYVDSLGTKAQNIAKVIEKTFTALEDSFIAFIKNSDFNWKSFAQGILDDLLKIIIRAQVIGPIASALNLAITNWATPTPTAATGTTYRGNQGYSPNAHGNIFDNGLTAFANGGSIVDRATTFGYGKGQRGLMGEAGPEAILPLTRGSNGNLGVQATVTPVNVNIVNQTGGQVDQRETTGPSGEKTIEILIHNKVKDGMASGAFDKIMSQAYGLRRKGS